MSAIGHRLARLGTLITIGALAAVLVPGGTPASAADTALVEASSGKTVTVAVGDSITVALPAAYRPFTTAARILPLESSSGGFPTTQPLAATFRAVAPGTADLATLTDYPCLHTVVPPCTVPQRQWIVHVRVVPPARTVTVTEADSGSTVPLNVGDTLVVILGSSYRPTTLSGPALVLQQSTGGFPTERPLLASYFARQPGEADVASMTDATCLHTVPRCTIPQLQWIVHVTVNR